MNNPLHGLYVLTDQRIPFDRWPEIVEACLRGGARIIQLREKTKSDEALLPVAIELQRLCTQYKALFIVNDRISLAKKCDADGVHIGAHDEKLEQARAILQADKIIGVSCYNELQRAYCAQSNGADYVAFGSVFPSTTKPDAVHVTLSTLKQAKQNILIPICAIGGINASNAKQVSNLGLSMLAVSHAVFAAKNPTLAARDISRLFD